MVRYGLYYGAAPPLKPSKMVFKDGPSAGVARGSGTKEWTSKLVHSFVPLPLATPFVQSGRYYILSIGV